jgi:hypothetical protein
MGNSPFLNNLAEQLLDFSYLYVTQLPRQTFFLLAQLNYH